MPGLTHTSPVALSRRMRNDSTGPLRILHELRPIKGVMYIIPFHSGHEGYAVLLEEVQELWEAIRADDDAHAKREAIQVAAMAIRYLVMLC